MSNTRFFPSNRFDALAYLYVQNQDLSGKSIEEIYDLYTDTFKKLSEYAQRQNDQE